MFYNEDNMVDLVTQVDDILASDIGELLSLLYTNATYVKTDLKFGSDKNMNKYVFKNAYAIKTIQGYSLFLDLYHKERNEEFTFGIFNINDIEFNLVSHSEKEAIEKIYFDCEGIEETYKILIYKQDS